MNDKASITALMSLFGRAFHAKMKNIRFFRITLLKN